MQDTSSLQFKNIVYIIILMIIAAGLIAMYPRWQANRQIEAGNGLAAVGKFAEAIQKYEAAAKIQPKLARPLVNIGLVYWRMQDMDSAIKKFQEAIALEPTYGDAHYHLAAAYAYYFRTDDAIKSLMNAFGIDRKYQGQAASDPNFANIKNDSRFQEAMNY
jgi:tetratricopeptide (TPR) repeat protein